jgi:secondary thiamine-phosphate synthase enzyme
MQVLSARISVPAKGELDVIDITGRVQNEVSKSGLRRGLVNAFVPGSTASVSTIEFEPNLVRDFGDAMEVIVPSDREYRHHKTWGDENGKSHVRATLMGPGTSVPFEEGKLLLGTWQQLVLLDFDVPARRREIVLTIIGD